MSITDVSTKTLRIPALERDFKEGALYDARSEQIVTGYSLWKVDDLKKIEVHRNDSTNYSINVSDTLSEKFKGLDASASVQLSLVSELIDLRGTTETAMQSKNTRGECSVQVRGFFKTGYKEMDMDQLTNIRYPDVARTGNNKTATHFVTKIQYGAGAVFTFTKQFQSSEDETKVKDEIEFCGKQIQSVLNGVDGRNFASHSQIKCEFQSFGLSLSEALPTTFDEAVRFAGSFARTAQQSFARHGNEALGVPCTVWLHPLVMVPGCADAPKLYWDFTPDQTCQWYAIDAVSRDVFPFLFRVIDFYSGDGTNARDETRKKVCDVLDRKIEFVTKHRTESKTKLREMLVEIRSGTKTFEYFQQQTKSLTNRLDGLSEFITQKNQENSYFLFYDLESSINAIEQYECS